MPQVHGQDEGTSLPENHSAPALLTRVPPAEIPSEAQYDTLATPTMRGRQRPSQHLDPADDPDEDE